MHLRDNEFMMADGLCEQNFSYSQVHFNWNKNGMNITKRIQEVKERLNTLNH